MYTHTHVRIHCGNVVCQIKEVKVKHHHHNGLQPSHYSSSFYTLFHTLASSLSAELAPISPSFLSCLRAFRRKWKMSGIR